MTGGTAGAGGMAGGSTSGMDTAGMTGAAGNEEAGSTGTAGMGDTGETGAAGSGPTMMGTGMCCDDGNCLCHGDVPSELSSRAGSFKTATFEMSTGTVYYPTDAEPPFAAIAICPGFLNTGPEMTPWGPFYASWGIVTVVTYTGPADIPAIRAALLLGALDELKKVTGGSGSPLSGKLSDRFGTSGYSMGGGGTTIAAADTPSLKTSIGLAPWGGVGAGNTVPTLLLCGDADTVAPCIMAQGAYGEMPQATPKMLIVIPGATHFNWFGPTDTSGGMSGKYALAFQKVFLEGDTRWKPLLTKAPGGSASVDTNIK